MNAWPCTWQDIAFRRLSVGLHSSPNAICVIYRWAIFEWRGIAIVDQNPGMTPTVLCVYPFHWREDRPLFGGRNCAPVTVNFLHSAWIDFDRFESYHIPGSRPFPSPDRLRTLLLWLCMSQTSTFKVAMSILRCGRYDEGDFTSPGLSLTQTW